MRQRNFSFLYRFLQTVLVLTLCFAPFSATANVAASAQAGSEAGGLLFLPNVDGGDARHNPGISVNAPAHSQSAPPVELVIGYGLPGEDVYAASTDGGQAVHAVDSTLALYGAQVVDTLPQLQAQVVAVPAEFADDLAAALQNQPGIAYVEPNYLVQGQFVPNDPFYELHQYAPKQIEAEGAWAITTGDESVLVAVVDSGATFNHPDLHDKLEVGWNYVDNNNTPVDDHGHGTHVAGIIGAGFNNGIGIAGIGGDTKVLVYKALNENNVGTTSNIAAAVVAATDAGARIVNLSLGTTGDSAVLRNATEYAWERNVLVVAAAGNSGSEAPFYPAAYTHVLGVSMTDSTDTFATQSNYGDWVSVAAPGMGIRSTDWSAAHEPSVYGIRSGTSMAAPHVAGVAALVLSVYDMDTAQLRALLESTADDLGEAGFDVRYGHGRINARRAVEAAFSLAEPTSEPQPEPTQEPTPEQTPVPTQEPTPSPTPSPTPTPTASPTAEATPVPTSTPTSEPGPIQEAPEQPAPQPGNQMMIGALTGKGVDWGTSWYAHVDVAVIDDNGGAVSSALVHGEWQGGFSGAASCVTNNQGLCTIVSGRVNSDAASASFEILAVENGTLDYQPGGKQLISVGRP